MILNSICSNSCDFENGVLPALIPLAENSKIPINKDTTTALKRPFWTTNQLSCYSHSRIRIKKFSPLKQNKAPPNSSTFKSVDFTLLPLARNAKVIK